MAVPASRALFVVGRLGKGAPGRGGGVRCTELCFPVWQPLATGGCFHAREQKCFLFSLKVYNLRNYLLAQRLGLSLSRAQVQSLVGELQSRKLCSQKKKKGVPVFSALTSHT